MNPHQTSTLVVVHAVKRALARESAHAKSSSRAHQCVHRCRTRPLQHLVYASYAPQPQPSGYLSLSKRQAGWRRLVSAGSTPARVEELPHAANHQWLSVSLYPVFGVTCRQVRAFPAAARFFAPPEIFGAHLLRPATFPGCICHLTDFQVVLFGNSENPACCLLLESLPKLTSSI